MTGKLTPLQNKKQSEKITQKLKIKLFQRYKQWSNMCDLFTDSAEKAVFMLEQYLKIF